MGSVSGWSDDEERSVIGEKGELPFMDYQEDKSVCDYDQNDNNSYVVSAPFPFVGGNPQSVIVGAVAKDSITIKNNTDQQADIWSISIYASEPENSFILSLKDPSPSESTENSSQAFCGSFSLEDRALAAGQTLIVWLSVKPESIGIYRTAVHVNIDNEIIERVVILMVDNKISQSLASNRPYSRVVKKKHNEAVTGYVRGVRPVRKEASGRFRKRLPMYPIPKEIRELVADKQIPDVLKGGLTRENYVSFFHNLLYLEELKLEEDMRAFDMEGVYIYRKGSQYLTLEVPGLAERRPSVVSGDSVFVRPSSDYESNDKFEGVVHRVEADEIYMKFDKDFHNRHRDTNVYNVEFTYNRTNMRRLYAATEGAQNLDMTLLFPSSNMSKKGRRIRTTPLVPISCMLNEEQMCAIEMIIGCRGMPPYLIHGPPGTGKTMTIAEGILQLYLKQGARILVCAPSNSAADHILEILLGSEAGGEMKEEEVFRLNAVSRSQEEVSAEIMPFCFFDEVELDFKCPALNALRRYRIIISTYMSASHLVAEGVPRGHFSHIFLDEAGQASEPESMIPLSNLCDKNTVVVLAGDPMQLGPIVHSKKAENLGLGKSYMERLFESSDYYGSGGDENYVVRLVRNYRCHPQILHLPSELFYQGELQACRDDSRYLDLDFLLPNKDFPILFIGIQGCDEREGNNPSWFNRIEASKVVEVVEMLKQVAGEKDIGIITPYRQQVLKLKKAFESLGMSEIKIGSVEQFQGQEREVMVVSTVRSTVKHNEFDRVHCLGFLSNPRRFNVAITRAMSLLVIVGNPHIICKDPHWKKMLWYCVDNDSYKGCTLPERDENKDLMEENGDNGNNNGYYDGGNAWDSNNNTNYYSDGGNSWDNSNNIDKWEDNNNNNDKWEDNNNNNDRWEDEEFKQQEETLQNHSISNEDEWSDGWKS